VSAGCRVPAGLLAVYGRALARLKGPVAEYLERAGLFDAVGRERVYLEVDDAVAVLRTMAPPVVDDPASPQGTG